MADIEGELAATCALGLNKSIANGGRPFAIIEHVITAEKFRRRGLSQQVLEFGIQKAWELNCYKVMLLSGENLTGATIGRACTLPLLLALSSANIIPTI